MQLFLSWYSWYNQYIKWAENLWQWIAIQMSCIMWFRGGFCARRSAVVAGSCLPALGQHLGTWGWLQAKLPAASPLFSHWKAKGRGWKADCGKERWRKRVRRKGNDPNGGKEGGPCRHGSCAITWVLAALGFKIQILRNPPAAGSMQSNVWSRPGPNPRSIGIHFDPCAT